MPIGQIHGILITQININTLKKTRIINLKLSQAIEQSANAVLITDIDGSIEYVNRKFIKITGYNLDEVIGKNPRILKSGKHDGEFYKGIWDTIKSKKIWNGEILNKNKNGDLYWEKSSISAILNSSGEITNYLAIKEDITERKKMEELLLVKDSILGMNQQIANIGSWDFDLQNDKLFWSIDTYRIFGFENKKDGINYSKFLEFIHPEDRKTVHENYQKAILESKPFTLTYRIIRANGEVRVIKASSIEIKNSQGKVIRSVGSIIDITNIVNWNDLMNAPKANFKQEDYYSLNTENIKNQLNKLTNSLGKAYILCKLNIEEDYFSYVAHNSLFLNELEIIVDILNKTNKEITIFENIDIEVFKKVVIENSDFEFDFFIASKKQSLHAKCYSPENKYFVVIF